MNQSKSNICYLLVYYYFFYRSKALTVVKNLSALIPGATIGDLTSLEGLVRYYNTKYKCIELELSFFFVFQGTTIQNILGHSVNNII